MSTPERDHFGVFQIEVGTMEGFLKLLGSREEEDDLSRDDALVTRRVRAAFAYGEDLVTLTRVTADGYEFPSPSDDVEKTTPARKRSSRRPGAKSGRDRPLSASRCRSASVGSSTRAWTGSAKTEPEVVSVEGSVVSAG